MKIALSLLIGLHGIIHLFGFLKAFDLYEFSGLTQPISKPSGIIWLVAFLLFALTLILLLTENNFWWATGFAAVLLSQILIFFFWQDAKFGTIANVIILLACTAGFGAFSFTQKINQETKAIISKSNAGVNAVALKSTKNLPAPVQNWLERSGVNENTSIDNVYLKQDIRMKLKPEQTTWSKANAQQYFTIDPPAFNWSVNLQMNPFLSIRGRDKFENGQGEMLMKIASIFNVVDVKNNPKINEGALQRYLAEIVWFPVAALSPHIEWEHIDDRKARATLTYHGTKGSGIFHFNDNGDVEQFSTMRFMDSGVDAQKKEWLVNTVEWATFNGIRVPSKSSVTWKLEQQDWTWLEVEITALEYNIESM